MTRICLHSGSRTTGKELPSDSEHWRQMWERFRQEANPAEPPPTGQQVLQMQREEIEIPQKIAREQAHLDRNVTEDYRQPVPKEARIAEQLLHTASGVRQDMNAGR